MRELPEHADGLIVDGHDHTRAELAAQLRAHMIGRGVHQLDVDEHIASRQNLCSRAWWGGDDVGFVQEHHPNAKPVTVVKVALPKKDVSA